MTFENEKLSILYGSQTGNAQDLAERIWRESKRFHFRATVRPLDDYDPLDLPEERCAIFVCSTTGQGEEPDNMKSFWRFLLRRSLRPNLLCNLRYAVFGLGDSGYIKYNFVAKRLNRRLLQLGASPLTSLGLGDDQHDLGYDATADPWMEDLWRELLQLCPLPSGVQSLPKNYEIKPRWQISTPLEPNAAFKQQSIYYSVKKSSDFTATVVKNERLTSTDHFQDVRLIALKTSGQKYMPGDVVVIRPQNLPTQIEDFYNLLESSNVKIPMDFVYKLSENVEGSPIPEVLKQGVRFRDLCQEYFDLSAIPRRYTFEVLAQLTDSELEKEKCLEFTTAEGQQELYSYVNRPRRTIVEVLQDFPHATKNLTLEMLFEILPPIKPREFSIASSYKTMRDEICILLAIVRYKTKLVKERKGLASNFLADLKVGDEITAWIKGGSFKFPSDHNIPVIMVGPGTGVAPFRSYVLERCTEKTSNAENLVLFFGCRYRDKDFLCEEFQQLHDQGRFKLITAFSRDGPDKKYVQHKIREHGALAWQMLQNGGHIFLAGNAKNMPQGVREAFIDVAIKHGDMSKEEATEYVESLEKQGRYQTECW